MIRIVVTLDEIVPGDVMETYAPGFRSIPFMIIGCTTPEGVFDPSRRERCKHFLVWYMNEHVRMISIMLGETDIKDGHYVMVQRASDAVM